MCDKTCQDLRATHEVAAKAYATAWPNSCVICQGAGGRWEYDRDTGATWPELCPACLENLRCPRCGADVPEELLDEGAPGLYSRCEACHWVWGEQAPEAPECLCYLDEDLSDLDLAWEREHPAEVREPGPLEDLAYDAWREGSFRGMGR